jgi:hypothetical protein
MGGSHMDLPVGFTNESVPASCHACLIYDDDRERKRIVSRFLAAGLENRELVRYFSDGTTEDEVRSWLSELGTAIPRRDGRDCLAFADAACAYSADAPFEPRAMIERTLRAAEAAATAGFTGLRSVGEMTWVLRGMRGAERWLEYEEMLNRAVTEIPRIGMCQYDARRFDGRALFKVLQVHPYVIANGQIVRNPCYVPTTSPGPVAANPDRSPAAR